MQQTHRTDDGATARRGFIGRILAGTAALAAFGSPARLLGGTPLLNRGATLPAGPGDDWMKALTATHRTVFDAAAHRNGKPLAQAKNFLDAWRDAFKTAEGHVNLVIGVHGEAIPFVLDDAFWSRYRIGEQYEVTDGETKAPAVRNVFSAASAAAAGVVTADQTVEALQKRGVRFLVCMNTIAGASRKLSAAGLGSYDEIHAAIMSGLLPGVITVPAMVVALTQLQERGVKYTKVA